MYIKITHPLNIAIHVVLSSLANIDEYDCLIKTIIPIWIIAGVEWRKQKTFIVRDSSANYIKEQLQEAMGEAISQHYWKLYDLH